MPRIDDLEERIAHLTRAVEDLSDMVRAQGTQLDRLTHHTRMLMQREAEREADAGGPASLDNQRPPHW